MKLRRLPLVMTFALAALLAPAVRADAEGDFLKMMMEKHSPSIVTVRLVMNTEVNMMGQNQNQESRTEIHGVVVDPEGLVMISSAEFSTDAIEEMMGSPEGFSIKMTPTDFKVIVEREEKEYTAFLAATDSKLGLAFLKIEDLADRKLAAVDFTQAADAALGQNVTAVGRQAKGYDYAPFFETARVCGEIGKPRKAWMLDGSISGLGLPVFGEQGQVVGVLTNISSGIKEETHDELGLGRMMRMFGGGAGGQGNIFLLPGQAVSGVIDQAKKQAVDVAVERAKQKEEGAKEAAANPEKKEEAATSTEPAKEEEKKDEEKK